jgi:hypothetical protein
MPHALLALLLSAPAYAGANGEAPAVGEEDQVVTDQSVDGFSDLEDGQAGPRGVWELRLRLTEGYVPAEGNTPNIEAEVSVTPKPLPFTEFLLATWFEHDDVDNTTVIRAGWNQRWVKDGGRHSWIPSIGTLTEYDLRTPYVTTLPAYAPGATQGDTISETLTIAKYVGPGSFYLNGAVERRVFNTMICVNDEDVAYQPSQAPDKSTALPSYDGCDYWADWTFIGRVGYKLTVVPEKFDIVADYSIETNEFTTQAKSDTYPEPENHLPYNLLGLGLIYHMNEHVTLSPGIQIGLDGREETPQYNTGLFLLLE